MSRHASPFHCPYCGDENLFPREDGWECRSCLRAFAVTFLGQVGRPETVDQGVPSPVSPGADR
jgi:transposase-like protein